MLACDESTDASDTAKLLIFVRGVDDDKNATEELLDLQTLKDQTRGTDLFASVCSAVDDMKLPWSKVSRIITDGEQSGLSTLICKKLGEEGGNSMKLHCIIHQQHLKYDHVMKPVMKINFIRSRALCHRRFQQFLLDIHAENMLYITTMQFWAKKRTTDARTV